MILASFIKEGVSVKKFQKQSSKRSCSRQSLKKDIERLLSSNKYLVRRDREEGITLGEAGGTWVTSNIDNALIFGDQISVVPKPQRILKSRIDDALAKHVDPKFGKEYHFDDATPEEWAKLREGLLKDGYDALEITTSFGESVQHFWILKQPKLLSIEEALADLAEDGG